MNMPWVGRRSHEAMMVLVTSQLMELKAERIILLDRLASLGLGGPLFTCPVATAPEMADDEAPDEAAELEQLMMSWRRRPSKLADALTSRARRAQPQAGPRVAWIPQNDAAQSALDAAEAAGKIQA